MKPTSGRWARRASGHAVLGPLVNRARGCRARGAAGQVLADRATYQRTRQAFACRVLDSDGTPAPAQVYEVVGPLAHPTKTRGIEGLRAELIGRDEELANLAGRWRACRPARARWWR